MADEGKGLLDRVGDHENLALGPLRRERANGLRDVLRLAQEIADQHRFRARPQRFRRRQAGGGSAAHRSSAAIASAKRSMTSRVASGRVRPMRPARSPPRTGKIRQGERQDGGAIDLGAGREARSEGHRRRAIEPDPDRVRGLPFALAHEGAVLARRAAPVDARRRLAGDEGAKLPEGFARARLPSPMDAVHQRVRDLPRGDDEARQARRERRGFLTNSPV